MKLARAPASFLQAVKQGYLSIMSWFFSNKAQKQKQSLTSPEDFLPENLSSLLGTSEQSQAPPSPTQRSSTSSASSSASSQNPLSTPSSSTSSSSNTNPLFGTYNPVTKNVGDDSRLGSLHFPDQRFMVPDESHKYEMRQKEWEAKQRGDVQPSTEDSSSSSPPLPPTYLEKFGQVMSQWDETIFATAKKIVSFSMNSEVMEKEVVLSVPSLSGRLPASRALVMEQAKVNCGDYFLDFCNCLEKATFMQKGMTGPCQAMKRTYEDCESAQIKILVALTYGSPSNTVGENVQLAHLANRLYRRQRETNMAKLRSSENFVDKHTWMTRTFMKSEDLAKAVDEEIEWENVPSRPI